MDYVQALFSFFIAPLFGTVVLGMLWKRATKAGGFWGLLLGTVSSIGMFIYTSTGGSAALSRIALSADARPMAEKPLPRPLELAHLRRRHRRRQLYDQADAGIASSPASSTAQPPSPTTAQPASSRSPSSGPSSSSSSSSSSTLSSSKSVTPHPSCEEVSSWQKEQDAERCSPSGSLSAVSC